MNDTHLIGAMRHLKSQMEFIADHLDERENANHAAELRGAANILQTWIDGISAEVKARRAAKFMDDIDGDALASGGF